MADWRRFEDYAHRVHTLKYNNLENINGFNPSFIAKSTFIMIPLHRPHASPLLPNLSSLSWAFGIPRDIHAATGINPFLSPGLTSIQIKISTPPSEELAAIWRNLVDRTPSVTSIRILMDPDVSATWDADGSGWITSCKRLESITLPRHWDSPPIVEALESLPALRCIQVDRSQDFYHWLSQDRISFLPRWLRDETFPNLRLASFDAPLPRLLEALRACTKFERLTGLDFGNESGPLTLLPEILTLIVGQCSHLESISFDFTSHRDNNWMDSVYFEAFRPLLSCRNLSHVEIRHDRPIDLQESDIEDIGKAWPNLTYFSLEALWGAIQEDNPSLDGDTSLGMPIDRLAVFPTHLPRLEHLGLHFDRKNWLTSDLKPQTSFSHLSTLSVGTSAVPGLFEDVADFLFRLCPPDFKIMCNKHQLKSKDVQAWWWVEREFQSLVDESEVCILGVLPSHMLTISTVTVRIWR